MNRNKLAPRKYEPAVQLNDDLARAMVIDLLELANVACQGRMSAMLRRLKSRQIRDKTASETCKISAMSIYRALKRQTSWAVETGRLVISPNLKQLRNKTKLKRNQIHTPCFCMTLRNLTMTFELGRMRTWRLPAFSALFMDLRASLRTEVWTILAVWAVLSRFSNRAKRYEVSVGFGATEQNPSLVFAQPERGCSIASKVSHQ